MALPQQPDILSVILEKRKVLHDQKGFSFGHSIPLKREKRGCFSAGKVQFSK